MNEQNDNAEQRYEGLTTAALAEGSEETAMRKDLELLPTETDTQRISRAGIESMVNEGGAVAAPAATEDEQSTALLSLDEAKKLRVRWDAIQGSFVDEPRHAVEQADSLVAEAMKRLAEMFAEERAKLEGQWDRKEGVSTEDLRLALRRYRTFFGRLLTV